MVKIKWTKLICHRLPERSLKFKGYYFPVCARCTGIYIGYILSFIIFLICPDIKLTLLYGELLIIPMFMDGYTQLLGLRESNNKLRLITGLFGGMGLMIITIFLSSVINIIIIPS